MILYIDQQEKQIDDIIMHLNDGTRYEVADLKYGDYTNDIASFVVERKRWDDYYGSVKDGSLIEQCKKIRANFKGLAGVLFEGDFWAMVSTLNVGLRHKMVFTRYRITHQYGMFFEECFSRKHMIRSLEFLNENAHKITRNVAEFKIPTVKTVDKRILTLIAVPGVGKKMATKLLNMYGSVYELLHSIAENSDDVKKNVDGLGDKTIANIYSMFLSDDAYANKVLSKAELKKLRKFHVKRRVVYDKIAGKRNNDPQS